MQTYPGYTVETSALLNEARGWEELALATEALATKASSMKFTAANVLLFGEFAPGYNDLVDAVAARCLEGGREMVGIRDTLGYIARRYEAAEAKHSHVIQKSAE
jgi:hypothetical protein